MGSIPIALQLYSIRDACKENFPEVLEKVARMGYDGVEFAGYHNLEATELKKILDDNGLKVAGTHTGIQTVLGEEFDKTVEYNKALGNPFLIVPWLPDEYTESLAAWKKTAELFNEIAERAAAVEMRVGYHNHHKEFQRIDGQYPWDVFFGTAREDVIMQLDTGNARMADVDVSPFIERYPGRAITVHLKEFMGGTRSGIIGQGDVPWQAIFKLCESVGKTEWYIVEQESYEEAPMVCVEKCLKNLRDMGK